MSDRPDERGSRRGPRDDDRPHGFQPQRMRQIWEEIDRARDELGLGPGPGSEPPPSEPPWTLTGLVDRAGALAASVLGWIGAGPVRPTVEANGAGGEGARERGAPAGPAPTCAPLAFGIDVLSRVPVVGRLVTFLGRG